MRRLLGWICVRLVELAWLVLLYGTLALHRIRRAWRKRRRNASRLLGLMLCLACAGCAVRELPAVAKQPPKIGLAGPPLANVGHRWPLTIVLRGDFPHGPLVLQAVAEKRLLINKTVDIDLARYYLYHIYFDESFYVAVAQERRLSGFDWDGVIRVDVRAAELMFSTSAGWYPGTALAHSWKLLRLDCWQCCTNEAMR